MVQGRIPGRPPERKSKLTERGEKDHESRAGDRVHDLAQDWATTMARFHRRHFWLVLLAAAALSALAYSALGRLKLDTSLEALMPDGVASVENLHRVLEKTGSFASAMVVITSNGRENGEEDGEEDGREAGARFAAGLRDKILAEFDWVASADYGEDISLFARHRLLYLEAGELRALEARLEERAAEADVSLFSEFAGIPVTIHLRSEPVYPAISTAEIEREIADITGGEEEISAASSNGDNRRLFQASNGNGGTVTLLVVWPRPANSGLGASKRIIDDLNRAISEMDAGLYGANLEARVGGRIYNRMVQFNAVISDVSTSGIWSFSLIALLLVATFRSLTSLVLVALPLVVSILWTMALAALVIGGLNLVTVFLVLILFGLGVDFGIHNLARFSETRAGGGSLEEALSAVFRHTGRASVVAALTTAAGFYALMITDFRAFWEFGLIAGTGILLAFLAMYVLFPSLLVLADKMSLAPAPGSGREMGAPMWAAAVRHPRAALSATVVLAIAAALWATSAGFEKDFGRLQAARSAEHNAMQANISRVFPDGTDRAVLIVETTGEVRAILEYFEAYMAADTDTPTIKKVESFYSYAPLPEVQAERLAIIAGIRKRVRELGLAPPGDAAGGDDWRRYLEIGGIAPEDLPSGLKRMFTGIGGPEDEGTGSEGVGGHLIYIFNSVSMNQADLARQFADDIRTIRVGGRSYYPATEGLVFVDMLELMKGDALKAILAVVGTTVAALMLFFRSWRKTLLVLVPPALGLLLLFGVMGWAGLRLNIFNMVILPAIIGIGVDNGIHILHRLSEERGPVEKDSLSRVMRTTGRAAAVTTLTTMLGFSGMLAASMGGLKSLGIVATLGFGACLLATFMALPPLLLKFGPSLYEKPHR